MLGVNDRIEIWDLDKFNNLMKEKERELDEISENLFSGDFEDEA